MYDYSKIKKYVLWLKKNEHLSVSIHSAGNLSIVTEPELSAFNVHDNPYCAYIKGCRCAAADCVKKQKKAEEKCRAGVYFGMCRARSGGVCLSGKSIRQDGRLHLRQRILLAGGRGKGKAGGNALLA